MNGTSISKLCASFERERISFLKGTFNIIVALKGEEISPIATTRIQKLKTMTDHFANSARQFNRPLCKI